jgi:putative pyruvate formate lyase activating enzyme
MMRQYFPAHLAPATPGFDRKVSDDEYDEAVGYLEEFDLENGWVQE